MAVTKWPLLDVRNVIPLPILKLLHAIAKGSIIQVLGLWGMGGIGKTALAANLFNSLLPTFKDAACFISDVRKEASAEAGLVKLQHKFLKALTGTHTVVEDGDTYLPPDRSVAYASSARVFSGGPVYGYVIECTNASSAHLRWDLYALWLLQAARG